MVEVVRDVVPLVALAVLLAVAVVHPPPRAEALMAVLAAGTVLALGVIDAGSVRAELAHLAPVVGFLVAILVVAECCRAEGLFAAIGSRLAATRARRTLFDRTFLIAAVVTVALSLDATVVLLTPVAIVAASRLSPPGRPALTPAVQLVCVRLANSASLLLPVSNLTNLLAMPSTDVGFGRFAVLMLPPLLVVLAVEYVVHRWRFRAALAEAGTGADPRETAPAPIAPASSPPAPIPPVPLLVVSLMLAGFAGGSALGLEPVWAAGAAAVALGLRALARGTSTARGLVASTHPTFALFVLALGVVVDLLLLALIGATLANLLNNLPATLLLAPLAAPLGPEAVLAALIGINLGSSLTWPGSLANLLWRRTVLAQGGSVSSRDFHLVGLLVVPAAILAGVTTLHLWSMVL